MNTSINVLYFGCEINTVFLLAHDEKFCLKAVARNPTFIKYKTYNPIDRLFGLIYRKHYEGGSRTLLLLYLRLFQLLSFLASSYFKIHKPYLTLLVSNRIKIVDEKKVDKLTAFVKEQNIGLFIINCWSILPSKIVRLSPLGCVNIHPSKLPMYKGALPTLWALKNKDKSSAITYMLIDETMDGGKIFAQHDFSILPTDTSIDMERRISDIVERTFLQDLKAFLENRLVLQEQGGTGCVTGRFEPYRQVDFKQEQDVDILNKILYYNYSDPSLNCYTYHGGSKIVLKGCHKPKDNVRLDPGYYSVKGLCLYVGCKNSVLCFKAVKDIALTHFFKLYIRQLLSRDSFHTKQISHRVVNR